MDSVKSACCWLVGVLKAGYHTRSSTGISVMAALTFLGTVSVVPCGQWGFCTIENVPISLKPPWSNLGFFPSVQPNQGPTTRTCWFRSAALLGLRLFHLLLHAALSWVGCVVPHLLLWSGLHEGDRAISSEAHAVFKSELLHRLKKEELAF